MRAIHATTNLAHHIDDCTQMQRGVTGDLIEKLSLTNSSEQGPFVFMSEVTRDCDVTARAVRKWQAKGHFPKAEGNLHGRCFWRRDTYRGWQAKVLSGFFAKSSNLFS